MDILIEVRKYKLHNLNWITNPHCQWLCQSNDRPWPRLAASFSKATLSGDIWCSPSDDEGRAVPHLNGEGEKVYLHRGNYLNFSSTLCDVPESGVWIEDQHVQCTKVMVVHESYWILIGTTVTVLGAIVCTPHDDLWCFLGTGVGWGGDVFAFLEVVKGWVGWGGMGFRFHSTTLSVVIYTRHLQWMITLWRTFSVRQILLWISCISCDFHRTFSKYTRFSEKSCEFLAGPLFEALRFSLGVFVAQKKTNDPKNSPEKTQGDLFEVPQALKPRDFCTPPKFNSSPLKMMGLED